MKPKLWLKGDILEVTWNPKIDKARCPVGTLVEFQNWLSSSEIYAVVKDNNESDVFLIVRYDLKLISRPGNPFHIGQQVQLRTEPEKQATVIGFDDKYNCILDQKLNPTKRPINELDAGHDFPKTASLWHCQYLSPVLPVTHLFFPQPSKSSNVFSKFNPLRLIRKVS